MIAERVDIRFISVRKLKMKVISSNYDVARYCTQMNDKSITVNRDYQRSDKIWPPASQSYLIDSILLGYPIPKLSLFQRTDLKSRKTVYEIVDGQQRSMAILAFYNNELRLTGKTDFHGMKYEDLEDEQSQRFLSYSLSVDVFVDADGETIRQVFRRINSYNVPLNPQERRHAEFQGGAKWFIIDLCDRYSSILNRIGVFTEAQLNRMNDAKLYTEICDAFVNGINHASEPRLDKFYEENEAKFPPEANLGKRLNTAFTKLVEWEPLHGTALMKTYNIYSLVLAISHCRLPAKKLQNVYEIGEPVKFDETLILPNLTQLAEVLEESETEVPKKMRAFYSACSGATNRLQQRTVRFQTFCKALLPELL